MIRTALAVVLVVGVWVAPPSVAQEPDAAMAKRETLILLTDTPDEGFELAIKLARRAVTSMQQDKGVLRAERKEYSQDAESLIAASHVVALNFQTIAAANDYWRNAQTR